ncbi:MAG TPA: glycine cleavage system protein GcvH [Candidatus Nitrosotenuis sp.]|jgi:glycine cleavage system H protein|nr:glycine cleavage system protein GcvH [Candidatus Nitrosotenuis sp.]
MLKFSDQHEWIKVDGQIGTVGITNYAQQSLGDIVFTELPAIGKHILKGHEAAVVESVKAASEVYSPVTGDVIAINTNLQNHPDLINTSPEEDGWFFKIQLSNLDELQSLMDSDVYRRFIGE